MGLTGMIVRGDQSWMTLFLFYCGTSIMVERYFIVAVMSGPG